MEIIKGYDRWLDPPEDECDCDEPCETMAEHKEKVLAAKEAWADLQFEMQRETNRSKKTT